MQMIDEHHTITAVFDHRNGFQVNLAVVLVYCPIHGASLVP